MFNSGFFGKQPRRLVVQPLLLILLLLVCTRLTGCGQTGPLILPENEQTAEDQRQESIEK